MKKIFSMIIVSCCLIFNKLFTMKLTRLCTLFLLITLISCSKDDAPSQPALILEMLDIMEKNSINRYNINWNDFRSEVLAITENDQSSNAINQAIVKALTLLEDNHSFYIPVMGPYLWSERGLSCPSITIIEPNLPSDIGYVRVRGYSGAANDNDAKAFAGGIKDKIRVTDHPDIKGWIVDLRSNTGGNMWPMLAGIGPVLGNGICGYFIDPDNNEFEWSYSNGTSLNQSYIMTQIISPYTLYNENPKVAVLTDVGTASSGEAIVAAFIGRPNTKSFGSATCGVSTSNQHYDLSDGSRLILTVSYMADRNKKQYGYSIEPDEVVGNENIIDAAINYIYE